MAKYDDGFCDLLIEHMASGFSYDSFPAYLHEKTGVSVSVMAMYKWEKLKGKEKWKDAKDFAQSKCLFFYEKLLRSGMVGIEFKVNGKVAKIDKTLIIFALKTRFHKVYGEKHDIGLESVVNLIFGKEDKGL